MRCGYVVFWSLLASVAFGQTGSGVPSQHGSVSTDQTGGVRVRVAFSNGANCDPQTRVRLIGDSGVPVADGSANWACTIEFSNLHNARYHVIVSGQDFQDTDAGICDVHKGETEEVEVKVDRGGGSSSSGGGAVSTALVPAADLQIPPSARKEFDKANQWIAQENWNRALDRLNKAIAIYPRYVEAYNNLGIVYGHIGDRNAQREALEKAIRTSDHFAPAYVNLALMAAADRDFSRAEMLLDKASAIDPTDSKTLVSLERTQYLSRHYEQAIATCRKAHSMAQSQHAMAHYIAAQVYEAEHQPQDALAELRLFLAEEKAGVHAEQVRKETARLQGILH